MLIAVTSISEALKDVLAANSLLAGAEVKRTYVPAYDVQNDVGLKVFVFPRSMETTDGSTRGAVAYKPVVYIAVMKGIDTDEGEQVPQTDSLLELVGRLISSIKFLSGLSSYQAAVTKAESLLLYEPASLDNGLFHSVIEVEFEVLI